MTIAWSAFTPWTSLAGGLVIGLAVAVLLLSSGRIAGISGILGGLLRPAAGELAWRAAFIAGLVAAPLAWGCLARLPAIHVDAGLPTLAVGGLLVGLGTRLSGGCTSGHGVCGLSRGSPRSLVATLAFMAAGFAVVFVVRHLLGH